MNYGWVNRQMDGGVNKQIAFWCTYIFRIPCIFTVVLILLEVPFSPIYAFYLAWVQGKEDWGVGSGHGGWKGVNKL